MTNFINSICCYALIKDLEGCLC